MSELINFTIQKINEAESAMYRWLTANDVGVNMSHQNGFLIPVCATRLAFDVDDVSEHILKKPIRIIWQIDEFTTNSVFTYYKSKRERRLTCISRYTPLFEESNVGSLFVLIKESTDLYRGIILSSDEDIDDFYGIYNLPPGSSNKLVQPSGLNNLNAQIAQRTSSITKMPSTTIMGQIAREISNRNYRFNENNIIDKSDFLISKWYDTEQYLFNYLENKLYYPVINRHFVNVQDFLEQAKVLINSRKSRAGKSLEHHLGEIFKLCKLRFDIQKPTEGNKRPDFIFPGITEYRNQLFNFEGLTFLGAKTTCKDRWRQVLNEANRIPNKHLFTLQNGISENQLQEMKDENLTLVVPKSNINSFSSNYHDIIMPLSGYIRLVQNKQNNYQHYYPLNL